MNRFGRCFSACGCVARKLAMEALFEEGMRNDSLAGFLSFPRRSFESPPGDEALRQLFCHVPDHRGFNPQENGFLPGCTKCYDRPAGVARTKQGIEWIDRKSSGFQLGPARGASCLILYSTDSRSPDRRRIHAPAAPMDSTTSPIRLCVHSRHCH